jgi:hypothetical protein
MNLMWVLRPLRTPPHFDFCTIVTRLSGIAPHGSRISVRVSEVSVFNTITQRLSEFCQRNKIARLRNAQFDVISEIGSNVVVEARRGQARRRGPR